MRKTLLKVLIITCLIFIGLTACEHNVYIPEDVWEVQGKTFYKFSEALAYMLSTKEAPKGSSKAVVETDIPYENQIILLRDVPQSERGEGIVVPESFPEDGNLCVNFNQHEYWFYDNLQYFLEIRNGNKIEIINGTTVIDRPANTVPAALVVNTKVVTIDEHLIDDRRPKPISVEVGEKGILNIQATTGEREYAFFGDISVAKGGNLALENGVSMASTGVVINGNLDVNGALLSAETITVQSDSSTEPATVNVTAGSLATINFNIKNNAVVTVNQGDEEETSVYIENTKFDGTSTLNIQSGTVTFRDTITGDTSDTTFTIDSGTIYNPHSVQDKVETAISEGSGGEVENPVIHEPLSTHKAKDATCTEAGNIAYWVCEYDGCGKWFADEDCTQLIEDHSSVVIEALGHDFPLVHHEYEEATCMHAGIIDCYQCSRCGHYFEDSSAIVEIPAEDVLIPQKDHVFEGSAWYVDGDSHWRECIFGCGTVGDYEKHDIDYTTYHYSNTKHWHECIVCGYRVDFENHNLYEFSPSQWTCLTGCGYSRDDRETELGFEAIATDPEPHGTISASYSAGSWKISVSVSSESPVISYLWYVDGNIQSGSVGNSFVFIPPRHESYVIMCIFGNEDGFFGSSTVVVGGST